MVTAEIANDPFLPLALAAEHTERIQLMTSIAVAFARNPMTLANIGNDLQAFSKGRFILGLGSQIKPHITKLLDGVVEAGGADARAGPRDAGDLGLLVRGREARLPRRVLPRTR